MVFIVRGFNYQNALLRRLQTIRNEVIIFLKILRNILKFLSVILYKKEMFVLMSANMLKTT